MIAIVNKEDAYNPSLRRWFRFPMVGPPAGHGLYEKGSYPTPPGALVQGDMPIDEFVELIEQEIAAKKEEEFYVAKMLDEQFPDLGLLVRENLWGYHLVYAPKEHREIPVVVDDLAEAYKKLHLLRMRRLAEDDLKKRFPGLTFLEGDIDGVCDPPYEESLRSLPPQKRSRRKWQVWMSDGTGTGYYFDYPLREDQEITLAELSEKSSRIDKENFFCSVCWEIKPKEEYEYYYFAERRCKSCATEEWLKRARSESYA